MGDVGLVALGAVLGAVLTWLADRLLPVAWRRLRHRPAIDVHIETDPGVFLAGGPNWDAFGYLLPLDLGAVGPPPSDFCRDWHEWAVSQGGIPAKWARIRVTLSGHLDATVLVDNIKVDVVSRTSIPSGTHVLCRTGGADTIPRGFNLDLEQDPPVAQFVSVGGETVYEPLGITVKKGEVEILEIEASAETQLVEWTAELGLVVNGKRESAQLSNSGRPFVISGTDKHVAYEWHDGWTALA